jgi:hypothetical protein
MPLYGQRLDPACGKVKIRRLLNGSLLNFNFLKCHGQLSDVNRIGSSPPNSFGISGYCRAVPRRNQGFKALIFVFQQIRYYVIIP